MAPPEPQNCTNMLAAYTFAYIFSGWQPAHLAIALDGSQHSGHLRSGCVMHG